MTSSCNDGESEVEGVDGEAILDGSGGTQYSPKGKGRKWKHSNPVVEHVASASVPTINKK